MNQEPTPQTVLVDTSLLNNPERLRERADAIEAWEAGLPTDRFLSEKEGWLELEEQSAFFYDRRYRARPLPGFMHEDYACNRNPQINL